MEDNNSPCALIDLCERLGTSIDLCAKAATPKYTRLDDAKHKYGGDATLVRLVTLERRRGPAQGLYDHHHQTPILKKH